MIIDILPNENYVLGPPLILGRWPHQKLHGECPRALCQLFVSLN
jgi:hypothetical protein